MERACNRGAPVLASVVGIGDIQNPYRARDAVTFFEPTPSERRPHPKRGVHARQLQRTGSLKRLGGVHLVIQVQTRATHGTMVGVLLFRHA